jgi:hypothetical protein
MTNLVGLRLEPVSSVKASNTLLTDLSAKKHSARLPFRAGRYVRCNRKKFHTLEKGESKGEK